MAWGLVFYVPWARGTVDHIRQCQVQHQREVFYLMEQKPGAYIRRDQENAAEKPAALYTWTQSRVLGGLGPALPHGLGRTADAESGRGAPWPSSQAASSNSCV